KLTPHLDMGFDESRFDAEARPHRHSARPKFLSIENWYYLLLAFPFADFTGLVGFLGLLFFTIVPSDDMNESTGIAARVIISTVPREHRSTEILLIVWLSGASTMLRKS